MLRSSYTQGYWHSFGEKNKFSICLFPFSLVVRELFSLFLLCIFSICCVPRGRRWAWSSSFRRQESLSAPDHGGGESNRVLFRCTNGFMHNAHSIHTRCAHSIALASRFFLFELFCKRGQSPSSSILCWLFVIVGLLLVLFFFGRNIFSAHKGPVELKDKRIELESIGNGCRRCHITTAAFYFAPLAMVSVYLWWRILWASQMRANHPHTRVPHRCIFYIHWKGWLWSSATNKRSVILCVSALEL